MRSYQPSFFDESKRLAALSRLSDPLEQLGKRIDFELFRAVLTDALRNPNRKSPAGRKPLDVGEFRNQEPHLREGEAQPSVDRSSTQAQPAKIQDPSLGRACVWIHGELNERNFPAVHRVEEGGLPDWLSKYGLQYVPLQPTHSPRKNQGRVKSKEQSKP